jgi:hypothetical protein
MRKDDAWEGAAGEEKEEEEGREGQERLSIEIKLCVYSWYGDMPQDFYFVDYTHDAPPETFSLYLSVSLRSRISRRGSVAHPVSPL